MVPLMLHAVIRIFLMGSLRNFWRRPIWMVVMERLAAGVVLGVVVSGLKIACRELQGAEYP